MAIDLHNNGASSQRPDPRTVTSLPEILSSLSSLEAEETELSNSLSQVLADRQPIVNALARLQLLEPHLNELYADASVLSGTVSTTAKTAARVGGRVRSLDEEMKRVREAGERVGQVMELKVRLYRLELTHCFIFASRPVFSACPPVCDGVPGLGVRDATLRSGNGPSS